MGASKPRHRDALPDRLDSGTILPMADAGTLPSDRRGDRARPGRETESRPAETGGPAGPEPTRFGDWERNGRCVDF
jgi:hypothetical protein